MQGKATEMVHVEVDAPNLKYSGVNSARFRVFRKLKIQDFLELLT
jgi:hypothetical protein